MQISAANAASPLPRPAVAGAASAPIVDLTKLAAAQASAKATAAAGAAVAQVTGDLTGALVNISA